MKFTISSGLLSDRLQLIKNVVDDKNPLPILSNFLFEITGKSLKITASNSESTLIATAELEDCEKDIRFVINAKTIEESVKQLPEQPLDIYINETNWETTVRYQNGQYNFMAQAADEFPEFSEDTTGAISFTIEASKLASAVSRTTFASADDPLRPVMNGVFFHLNENSLSFVASDGLKLACNKVLNIDNATVGGFILPKKPCALVKNIFSKEAGTVEISFTERNATFKSENFEFHSRLTEGRYPDYTRVIPKDNPNCATVNRDALIAALRRIYIFSNVASGLIKLEIGNSKLTISSQDTDYSMSAVESLLCDYNGIPISIGFKGPNLLDVVNNLQAEEVVLQLADASRAGIIVPVQNDADVESLMLIMPMMLAH
ncbi:MAG: DNA polymerase III subunit beta [Alloprevotella sp.]|nr:DNA polymerase III subunit beta [Alloprevotella sp.]